MNKQPYRVVSGGKADAELPRNEEAERAFLGALLIDNKLYEEVAGVLKPEHFFDPLHARIFNNLVRVLDRNMLASPITLQPLIGSDELLNERGGIDYLKRLANESSINAGIAGLAKQLFELGARREVYRVGREMMNGSLDMSGGVDPQPLIEQAELSLYKIAEQGFAGDRAVHLKTATAEAIRITAKAMASGGDLSGLDTGLKVLNERIGGLQNSDLLILAGRPAMGKTSLCTNIAFAVASRYVADKEANVPAEQSSGAGVAFFSLEMSADQLATRILAERSDISSEDLRRGRISQAEFRQLVRASQELETIPFFIDDTPGLTIASLRTRARRLKRQKNIGCVMVDYLQLLSGTSSSRGEGRVNEISEISRGLKALAKELNVPVIALSQLSRAVEQREDKRPQLADLRESGSIEQDADIVMFVFREEYYHNAKKFDEGSEKFHEWLAKAKKLAGKAEVIVAKNRHGSTGILPVGFKARTTKFHDVDEGETIVD